MRMLPGYFLISCDETSLVRHERCPASVEVNYDRSALSDHDLFDVARDVGWRVYAEGHRRDLCPGHHSAARRRLTLIREVS